MQRTQQCHFLANGIFETKTSSYSNDLLKGVGIAIRRRMHTNEPCTAGTPEKKKTKCRRLAWLQKQTGLLTLLSRRMVHISSKSKLLSSGKHLPSAVEKARTLHLCLSEQQLRCMSGKMQEMCQFVKAHTFKDSARSVVSPAVRRVTQDHIRLNASRREEMQHITCS